MIISLLKKGLFVLGFISFTDSLRAEEPWKCDSSNRMYSVLLSKPKKKDAPWDVKLFHYNSITSAYDQEKNVECKDPIVNKSIFLAPLLSDCEVIYGPDGGMNLTVKEIDGKKVVVFVPWGPTGSGEAIILPCHEGVK